MANISTLLARILTTRYGRDMRQDLHDAIEAVNDDTETALGKKLTFTTNTRKLKLLAKDDSVLSEVVIPGGGSGGGSVDSVNGLFPDENGNVELNLDDINDVDITSVSDGDALIYDAESHKWVNGAGGGGTSDYPDLTNKPQINGVTLSGNKTSADLGIFAPTITSPTSGQVIKYDGSNWVNGSVSGGSNRNLLDNPWFTVNQRGASSYNGLDLYTLDRWKNSYGTVTVNSGYININNPSGGYPFYQKVPKDVISADKVYTISVMTSAGNIVSKSFTASASYQTFEIDTIQGYVMRGAVDGSNSDYWQISLINSNAWSINIKAIKVELGTESTLALDTAPDYASELLKCQRYYYPLSGKEYIGFKTSNYKVKVPLPTEMRTTPSISLTGSSIGLSGSAQQGGSISSATVTVSGDEALVNVGLTMAGGGSDYNVCSAFEIFNLAGYLSAEL